MDLSERLRLYLKHYKSFGLNATVIKNERTEHNFSDKNLLKSPCHEWEFLEHEDQSEDDILKLDINDATGIGCVLGYKNLKAVDIDGCLDYRIVEDMLKTLNLPVDYKWVVKSGSHVGYHILFKCAPDEEDPVGSNQEYFNIYTNNGNTTAYRANKDYRHLFDKLELRITGHLVLPPSLHISSHEYEFIAGTFPKKAPDKVHSSSIIKLIDKFVIAGNQYHLLSHGSLRFDGFNLDEFVDQNDSKATDLALIYDFNAKYDDQNDEYELVDIAWKLYDGQYVYESKSYINKELEHGDSYLNYNNTSIVGKEQREILSELCKAIDRSSVWFGLNIREKHMQLQSMVIQSGVRQNLNYNENFDFDWIDAYHDYETEKGVFHIYRHIFNSMYTYSDISVPRNAITNVSMMLKCAHRIIRTEKFQQKDYKAKLDYG